MPWSNDPSKWKRGLLLHARPKVTLRGKEIKQVESTRGFLGKTKTLRLDDGVTAQECLYRGTSWAITAKSDDCETIDSRHIIFSRPVKPDLERRLTYTLRHTWVQQASSRGPAAIGRQAGKA